MQGQGPYSPVLARVLHCSWTCCRRSCQSQARAAPGTTMPRASTNNMPTKWVSFTFNMQHFCFVIASFIKFLNLSRDSISSYIPLYVDIQYIAFQFYSQHKQLVQFWPFRPYLHQGDNPSDSGNHDAHSTSSELLDMLLQEDARSGTGSNASGSGSGESGGSLGSGSGSGSNGTSTSHTGKWEYTDSCKTHLNIVCPLSLQNL